MKKTPPLLLFGFFACISSVHAETINSTPVIACPTVEAYQGFKLAVSDIPFFTAAAQYNCTTLSKGDKVTVVDWKMASELVQVEPVGQQRSYWLPEKYVTARQESQLR